MLGPVLVREYPRVMEVLADSSSSSLPYQVMVSPFWPSRSSALMAHL